MQAALSRIIDVRNEKNVFTGSCHRSANRTHRNSVGVFLPNFLSLRPSLFKRMFFLVFPLHWCTFTSSKHFVSCYQTRKCLPVFPKLTSKMALIVCFPGNHVMLCSPSFPDDVATWFIFRDSQLKRTGSYFPSTSTATILPDSNFLDLQQRKIIMKI